MNASSPTRFLSIPISSLTLGINCPQAPNSARLEHTSKVQETLLEQDMPEHIVGSFCVEGHNKVMTPPQRMKFHDIYREKFYYKMHFNFVCEKDGVGQSIYSVLAESNENCLASKGICDLGQVYDSLITDATGQHSFKINSLLLKRKGTTATSEDIEHFLNTQSQPPYSFYTIHGLEFASELLKVEQKNPFRRSQLKVGVIYAQKSVDILDNTTESRPPPPPPESRFWTFMKGIGVKVNTKTHTKYVGDMRCEGSDAEKDTYFTEWHKIEVMYHVSPLLNSEQHRRLIGNDVLIIIFFENFTEQFDYNICDFLGKMPQIFSLVTPFQGVDAYNVKFFKKSTIPYFEPLSPPSSYRLSISEVKDLLLTKFFNGYHQAFKVPPLNRLYTIPREYDIKQLVHSFPKTKKRPKTQVPCDAETFADMRATVELEDFLFHQQTNDEAPLLMIKKLRLPEEDEGNSCQILTPRCRFSTDNETHSGR
eukprot:TRINITY_DN13548_c0_g2_i9.p1 TRINITY_DN13548_c0_g2~~TRINITY_DN13548_c0_g2_i9.p1  ORF type:complete len:479 (-),score=92.68 TRINITY_DN13548_c0_g2_i9:5-1441(-)